jgi:hypothetical protein
MARVDAEREVPVVDNALEMAHHERAELRPIPSIWGHVAG